MPPWLAIIATVLVMIGLAILIERLVLRRLFVLAYVLEGAVLRDNLDEKRRRRSEF